MCKCVCRHLICHSILFYSSLICLNFLYLFIINDSLVCVCVSFFFSHSQIQCWLCLRSLLRWWWWWSRPGEVSCSCCCCPCLSSWPLPPPRRSSVCDDCVVVVALDSSCFVASWLISAVLVFASSCCCCEGVCCCCCCCCCCESFPISSCCLLTEFSSRLDLGNQLSVGKKGISICKMCVCVIYLHAALHFKSILNISYIQR